VTCGPSDVSLLHSIMSDPLQVKLTDI